MKHTSINSALTFTPLDTTMLEAESPTSSPNQNLSDRGHSNTLSNITSTNDTNHHVTRPPREAQNSIINDLGSLDEALLKDTSPLKNVRHRLVLLRHAAKCTVPLNERCEETRHCTKLKQLWTHMARCRALTCGEQHCLSNRSALTHYRRCKDARCDICQLVKEYKHKPTARTPKSSRRSMRQSRDAIAARTTKRLENEALPTNQHLRQHLKKAILTLLSARVLRKYGDPIPERYAARLLKYTDIFEENIHSTYSSQDYKEVASTSQGIITAIRGSIKHFRAQAMAITSSSSTPSIPDGINSQPSVGQDIDDELAELMGRTSIDG